MNRKTVLLPVAVGVVLLAVYGIWLYNPLKLLYPSKNQPRQTQVADLRAGAQPIVVKKKIPPRTETSVQQSDVPRPLVVLKEVIAEKPSESAGQNKLPANGAVEKDEVLVLQSDGNLTAKKSAPESAPPEPVSQSAAPRTESSAGKPESHLPYSILLSSCRLPQSARTIVAQHQKAGLAPYVVKVEFKNGDKWLRVFAGQYPTRNDALEVKKVHQLSNAMVTKTPYANLVGSYATEAEAKDSLKPLKDSGYAPYVLKRAENRFQVVVGAFITREGAEKQKSELQSKGIPNQIIER